jgi:hypothetical protein
MIFINTVDEGYVLDYLADGAGLSNESPLDTLLRLEEMQNSEEERDAVAIYVHDLFIHTRSL